MTEFGMWPWGLIIMLLLAFLIGWFIRDIIIRKILEEKDRIIQAQEREFVKLAQKHVQSQVEHKNKEEPTPPKSAQLASALALYSSADTEDEATGNVVDILPGDEEEENIALLQSEIDRLKIENQKLSAVPQALYIEKNKKQKAQIKKLEQALHLLKSERKKLKGELKHCKKNSQKINAAKEIIREIRIKEVIDFKKLKRKLSKIPTKKVKKVKVIMPKAKKKKPSSPE